MMDSKTILVTGANRGIGRETARQLVEMGHKVLLGIRDRAKAEQVQNELGKGAVALDLDITDSTSVTAVADRIQSEFRHLDVLVNNAGVFSSPEGPSCSSDEDMRAVMDVNLMGTWSLTNALLPLLQQADDPRIINVSSGMGSLDDLAAGDYGPYRMSKVSLNALTRLMAAELRGQVTISSMCPGWVRTDMGGPNATRDVSQGADTAVWFATAESVPHGVFLRDRQVIPW
jgi:NAD(P)-dependent dehydrogenase (short-subunit alcohol dehydrogenase family)